MTVRRPIPKSSRSNRSSCRTSCRSGPRRHARSSRRSSPRRRSQPLQPANVRDQVRRVKEARLGRASFVVNSRKCSLRIGKVLDEAAEDRPMACPGVSARLALYTAFAAAILIVQELRNSHAQEPFRSPQRNDDLAAGAPPPSQGHLQLTFSPWTKFCLTHGESHANHVCLTGKDGRGVSDLTMVAVVLIEPQGAPQKLLRVTLPVGEDVNSSV